MIRLTPVWTRRHSRLILAVTPAIIGTTLTAWESQWWIAVSVAALYLLTLAGGLAFDVFIASALGVVAAAAAIAIKQLTGTWGPEVFTVTAWEVLLFVVTGWTAGLLGASLRARDAEEPSIEDDALFTFSGPLGLLSPSSGEVRLEEEIERAELHRRPLSILRVRTEIRKGASITDEERVSIYRTVARLVEGTLRPTDIPFAYEDNSVVAILPEMVFEDSWQLVAPLVDALGEATFVVRPEGTRHFARDYADVQLSVVSHPDHGRTAYELLEASLDAMPEADAQASPERTSSPDANDK